jgi:hypothetical protein
MIQQARPSDNPDMLMRAYSFSLRRLRRVILMKFISINVPFKKMNVDTAQGAGLKAQGKSL